MIKSTMVGKPTKDVRVNCKRYTLLTWLTNNASHIIHVIAIKYESYNTVNTSV
jgi:hypothetical protein